MIPMRLHGSWRVPCDWHIHFCLILQNTKGGASVALCLVLLSTEDNVVVGGGDCNTPVLTPWYLIVHNVNIVLRSWHGAQGQGLAIDLVFCIYVIKVDA